MKAIIDGYMIKTSGLFGIGETLGEDAYGGVRETAMKDLKKAWNALKIPVTAAGAGFGAGAGLTALIAMLMSADKPEPVQVFYPGYQEQQTKANKNTTQVKAKK